MPCLGSVLRWRVSQSAAPPPGALRGRARLAGVLGGRVGGFGVLLCLVRHRSRRAFFSIVRGARCARRAPSAGSDRRNNSCICRLTCLQLEGSQWRWTMLTVTKLARRCGVSRTALLYYESIGLMPRPQRSGGNYRCYGEADLRRLHQIRAYREAGLKIDDIRAILKTNPDRPG